ncbi:hypothetical protein [Mesorhizobium sp. M0968]
MALHWFNPLVPVKTERPGIIRNVNNAEAAGEELMKWLLQKRRGHYSRQ